MRQYNPPILKVNIDSLMEGEAFIFEEEPRSKRRDLSD
jgi:hypothetical protein